MKDIWDMWMENIDYSRMRQITENTSKIDSQTEFELSGLNVSEKLYLKLMEGYGRDMIFKQRCIRRSCGTVLDNHGKAGRKVLWPYPQLSYECCIL